MNAKGEAGDQPDEPNVFDDGGAFDDAGAFDDGDEPEASDSSTAADQHEEGSAPASDHKHLRGSAALLMGRGVSLLITLATQVVMVRGLSKEDFGSFAYAFALAVAGRQILSLGQGKMLSRFMAKYDEERDFARMFGSMAVTGVTIVLTSSLAFGALVVLSRQGAGSDSGLDYQILLVLFLLAPMEALDQVFVSLFAVFSKARSIIFRKYLFTPLLRLGVVVAMVALNASITFLAIGYVITGLLGLFVYGQLFLRELRKRELLQELHPRRLIYPAREMISFSVPTLTTELVFLATNTVSVMILASQAGVDAVANFRAVMPTARLNQFVFVTFVTFFLPTVSRLFARNLHDRLRETYWHSALVLAVFTFPIIAMTGPFAEQTTVTLFGERYADSAIIMALLSLGYYFNVSFGYNAFMLQVYGKLRFLTVVNLSAAAVSVGLTFALVQVAGAVGVAIATAVTLIGQNLANQVMLTRTIETPLIDRSVLRPYVLIVTALTALTAVALVVQPNFVVALVVSALVSLVLLRLSRKQLQLVKTFPEIAKLGWAARLVT
ncbi:MAG: oligosaccharide flippase family protein [Actinomycetes bacterium]